MFMRHAFPLLLLLMAVGCSTEARTYSVSVRNESASPVTIALTKAGGGPAEEAWASPEQIAGGQVKLQSDSRVGFSTLLPGSTQNVRDVPGQFASGSRAVLRVYRGGDLTVKDMVDMKPGATRVDVDLQLGENRYVVREREAGRLAVEPAPAGN